MMRLHELKALRRAGLAQEQQAELIGVSVREFEDPVLVPDDAAEREKHGIGQPSMPEPFRNFVVKVPESLVLRIPFFAGPTAYVVHDTRLYSMRRELG